MMLSHLKNRRGTESYRKRKTEKIQLGATHIADNLTQEEKMAEPQRPAVSHPPDWRRLGSRDTRAGDAGTQGTSRCERSHHDGAAQSRGSEGGTRCLPAAAAPWSIPSVDTRPGAGAGAREGGHRSTAYASQLRAAARGQHVRAPAECGSHGACSGGHTARKGGRGPCAHVGGFSSAHTWNVPGQ